MVRQTIEARILAALRIDARQGNGPQTIAQLHRRPGLTIRRSPEIDSACQNLAERREIAWLPVRTNQGWKIGYRMPPGWIDSVVMPDAPCAPSEVPSRI